MNRILLPAMAALLVAVSACSKPDRPPCSEDTEIPTICGFRNPEDLEFVATANVVLVSNMRHDGPHPDGGYLSAIVPGDWVPRTVWGGDSPSPGDAEPALGDANCTSAPDPAAFYPHGLTSRATEDRLLIYLAAHAGTLGGREAIEIFELSGSGDSAQLTWKACIPSEDNVQLNDVAVSNDGLILASNYIPDSSLRHTLKAAIFRQPTGSAMTWTRDDGWAHLKETESLLANGVAISNDGEILFYVETVAGKLHRRPLASPRGAIDIDIEGSPDNLSWTSRGTLLLATHTQGLGLLNCFLRAGACRTGWAVYEIDPATMAARRVTTHSGDSIGAVATALEVKGDLLLSSVFDDRIGKMPQSSTNSGPKAP